MSGRVVCLTTESEAIRLDHFNRAERVYPAGKWLIQVAADAGRYDTPNNDPAVKYSENTAECAGCAA